MSDSPAQPLQLGVGQSVIRDLPEEAGEIYVGDPNVVASGVPAFNLTVALTIAF